MGDGPGYDHMYAERDRRSAERRREEAKRCDMLHQIMMGPGFGGHDKGDIIGKEIERHLTMAFELLCLRISQRQEK